LQLNETKRVRNRAAVVGAICLALHVMLTPHIGMGNGRINFAVVFCGVLALAEGGRHAVISGFVAGLVFDLLSTGPIGLMAGLGTLLSFALGYEERNRFLDGFVTSLSSFGVCSLICCLLYHLTMVLVGDTADLVDLLMMRTLPTFALTFVAFLPFAWYEVHGGGKGRGHGAHQKAAGLGGGHYDLKNLTGRP